MPVSIEELRPHLQAFDFPRLFVEGLGWDHYVAEPFVVRVNEGDYALSPIAEKAGFAVYQCDSGADDNVPQYPVRRKIESEVAKRAFEHLIIFTDPGRKTQVWQWVRREAGKPAACREYAYAAGGSGDPILQRLQTVAFTLEDEAKGMGISDVAPRMRRAFDVEKVTRRFYDRFRTELDAFAGFIQGITAQGDRDWYASLMLNRMMFVYFVQKQGFLDGDLDYLRNRLSMVQAIPAHPEPIPAHPELVEGHERVVVRQAHHERSRASNTPAHPEPVEGPEPVVVRQAHHERSRASNTPAHPEPVEGHEPIPAHPELVEGGGRFQQFYRLFLLRLFHEGLGQPESQRAPDLAALLGRVPFLNGGLFDQHELERDNPDISIPDDAFRRVFDFFDGYRWHLDERPDREDNEINPDVLGYIFEKYVNQKQMGAYYTKEDITGYISRNTVIPHLFDAAKKECRVAFEPDGGVWRLLRDDPDRYIYPAVGHGITWNARDPRDPTRLAPSPSTVAASPAHPELIEGGEGDVPPHPSLLPPGEKGLPPSMAAASPAHPELVEGGEGDAPPDRHRPCRGNPCGCPGGRRAPTRDAPTMRDRHSGESRNPGPPPGEKGLQLPAHIAAGIDDVSQRGGWNAPAPDDYALPTETWREVVARRQRYHEVRAKLASGEVHQVNDLITLNLDIEGFARDAIVHSEGPELLRAFWHALRDVSVLDPTCGSGAFLFAALNVLEPLYTACLEGMRGFLDDAARSERKRSPEYLSDFRGVIGQVEKHPSQRYFILKSIVLDNLYGVDIEQGAVEICKLRLFLKLVAQLESYEQIEPLPDIDFNVRAGNTLVGFTSLDAVQQAMTIMPNGQHRQVFPEDQADLDRINEQAEIASAAFNKFRWQQTIFSDDAHITSEHKAELRARLRSLDDELDRHLAKEYGISLNKASGFEPWRASHQPFHWFVEFYGIMAKGGFDVIIGNPPYVEYSKVRKEYQVSGFATVGCGNLYAMVIERSYSCLRRGGRFGMIVQLSYSCTDRMEPIQSLCLSQSGELWLSHFDDRPAKLFDGLEHIRATIALTRKSVDGPGAVHSTAYNRWYTEFRPQLFDTLAFGSLPDVSAVPGGTVPKIGSLPASTILKRIAKQRPVRNSLMPSGNGTVYFHNAPQYWVRAMDFAPYFWNERDGEQISTQVKTLTLASEIDAGATVAVLNSSLFYWWFLLLSDCRHLNLRDIESFPVGMGQMQKETKEQLARLTAELMESFKRHSQRKEARYKATGKVVYDEFDLKPSKPIVDKIDCVLGEHYGFTEEELDFIINYDIKYRMGREG